MSKLDELIKKYCPDGVEYKNLHDICEIRGRIGFRGYTKQDVVAEGEGAISLSPSNILNGEISFNKCTYISWSKYEESPEIKAEINDILFCKTASVGKTALIKKLPKEATINPQLVILKNISCNASYLSYVLKTNFFQEKINKIKGLGTVPTISQKELSLLSIPVPPLPVQEEIVRILDSFTELTARKQQYEYYRNLLIEKTEGIQGKLIDMLAQPITDGPHTTPKLFETGVPFVSATAVYDGKVHLSDMKGYISKEFDEECAKKYKPRRNDVFMVKSGSTTGKVAIVDFDDDFNVWSPLAAMRTNDKCSPRYLYHLLQTTDIQNQVVERISHGSQPNLSMRVLEQFDVKIPTLEVQNEVAEFLDKMDVICSDMFSGLPAEIVARQKQYEYYRDKLLTFKQLA